MDLDDKKIDDYVEERMNSIFWKVILKHLTPEVEAFIRQELKTVIKEYGSKT